MNPTESSHSAQINPAGFVRSLLPSGGLFAGHEWRFSPTPFPIGIELHKELETMGRVLLQFYRAINLLYRQSVSGKQPAWIAALFDQGKPDELIALQRHAAFKNDLPRVIRPDLLLTDAGISVTELDSVPGGMGLTAWLNQAYSTAARASGNPDAPLPIGGTDGMITGFSGIFGDAPRVQIVVSDESATYRPEMQWLADQADHGRFSVRDALYNEFQPGDAVYRFFELFDLANVANARQLFDLAAEKTIRLTPPPKAIFEEKLTLALLWNRNLRSFWRQELGESFFNRFFTRVPRSWVVDPAPLPPHGAIPELDLTDWNQLKSLSQRDRELVLKVSGYSAEAWGARGVYVGGDLSTAEWSAAVDKALAAWPQSPYILQRYHKPRIVQAQYFDFVAGKLQPMPGRVRLCPYYFVQGEGDAARANLGGVLATICPADKKIIHGMQDAILAPCMI